MEKIIDCSALDLDSYDRFLKAKLSPFYEVNDRIVKIKEQQITLDELKNVEKNESHLFDYQKFILNLAIKKQKYAIWADCGLGKTAIFLAWIRRLVTILEDKKIIIISPLMVIKQTLDEEKKFYEDCLITDIHKQKIEEWLNSDSKIGITNIDKFYKEYDFKNKILAVVLDESSILKNADGKTRNCLIESFKGVPFKLCCSATPAPNDREEYANHATFLDYVRSNNEFYSRFFVNKDNGWIIKPHGYESFYKFLAEWSVYLRNPEKYDFSNNISSLPKPDYHIKNIEWTEEQKKYLKQKNLLGEVSDALDKKIYYLKLSKGFINKDGKLNYIDTNKTREIINILEKHKGEKIVVWVIYNEEERILLKALKELKYNVTSISGKTKEEDRVKIIEEFRDNDCDILISKTTLLGFGLNMPFATVHIYSGMTDSYEQFYQSIKRSYRYGAKESLQVYIPITNAEKKILDNVLRKKDEFEHDSNKQEQFFILNLKGELDQFFNRPFIDVSIKDKNKKNQIKDTNWKIINGDSIRVLREMPKESIDFSVFSPPFASLFTYSNEIADMGNSGDGNNEFNLHFEYFLKGLHDVMKKGRIVCCHLSQLATLKSRDGYVGLRDFRGDVIRLFQKAGFIYFSEWTISKNPQMQAIKEKVRTLSFAQLKSDRLGSKAGLNDMILVFKKKGESDEILDNPTHETKEERNKPINEFDVSGDEWIEWACGVWTGIRESDTLNVRGTKQDDDVKHVCPLNLEVIRRCVRMYSKKGWTILDPFNGIGSSGVVSLQLKRKYIGIELKHEYFEESGYNLKRANIFESKPEVTIKQAMKIHKKQDNLYNFINNDGGTNFTKSSADDFPTESLISVKRESDDSPNSPHIDNKEKEEANFS